MIQLDHATLLYGTVIGINDFHIELPSGAYALVGPNGAGKSTFIGLLTGALKPTLGSVRVFDFDPFKQPQVLRRIGLCPASDLLIHGVSARQWLRLQLSLSGWAGRQGTKRLDELLDLVGLREAQHWPIHSYSLGMRQRCKLAQSLANDPDLLILDEPFNGLDPIGRHHMGQLLRDWSSRGKSLLLASHVLHEVERITDSFLLIYGGRLLASGTSGELRRLLAGLPQEILIRSSTPDALAERLATMNWLRQIQRSGEERELLTVAVDRPLELYESVAKWVAQGQVAVEQISGSEGDISALFHLLISKHRGEVMMKGVA
ncbi:MAG: ABC transporter ATP-binding protein [Pirellulaceae bacterium]|nr:ABC transporter ATP-binding protein [Pirellulaceae bacterium]